MNITFIDLENVGLNRFKRIVNKLDIEPFSQTFVFSHDHKAKAYCRDHFIHNIDKYSATEKQQADFAIISALTGVLLQVCKTPEALGIVCFRLVTDDKSLSTAFTNICESFNASWLIYPSEYGTKSTVKESPKKTTTANHVGHIAAMFTNGAKVEDVLRTYKNETDKKRCNKTIQLLIQKGRIKRSAKKAKIWILQPQLKP